MATAFFRLGRASAAATGGGRSSFTGLAAAATTRAVDGFHRQPHLSCSRNRGLSVGLILTFDGKFGLFFFKGPSLG